MTGGAEVLAVVGASLGAYALPAFLVKWRLDAEPREHRARHRITPSLSRWAGRAGLPARPASTDHDRNPA